MKEAVRRSSQLCQKQIPPRKGKEVPPMDEMKPYETHGKSFVTVFKCGLLNILRRKELLKPINDLSTAMTFVSFEASRLLNLHFLTLLERNDDVRVPHVYEKLVRYAFSLVQIPDDDDIQEQTTYITDTEDEAENRRSLFQTYVEKYRPMLKRSGFRPEQLPSSSSQVVTWAVKDYVTVATTHLESHYWKNLRTFCRSRFPDSFDETDACVKFFADPAQGTTDEEKKEEKLHGPTDEQIVKRYGNEMLMFRRTTLSDIVRSVYDSSLAIQDIKRRRIAMTVLATVTSTFREANDADDSLLQYM